MPRHLLAASLLLAWLLDARFGEPPDAWHPVAWLGRVLGPLGRRLCAWPAPTALLGGAAAWLGLGALLAVGASLLQGWLGRLPWWLGVPAGALLIKPCFAWRMLRDEVAGVERGLGESLQAGRERVARLASRDVHALGPCEVRETAIETLAENLNDSVVAPLLWFALAGLPGAVVYRFANTADAMWGYRGRYEWAGKFAARADDLLSWLPARLSALLLAPAPRAWPRLLRLAASTPSPNGGWPMGAMALKLGVRLRKPGVYALNAQAPSPTSLHTARALRVAGRAAWMGMLAAVLACAVGR